MKKALESCRDSVRVLEFGVPLGRVATSWTTPLQVHLQDLGLSMLFPPLGRGSGKGNSVSHSCLGKQAVPRGYLRKQSVSRDI